MENYITLSQTATLLKEWDNILIISHKSPDGDTVGSAYGLSAILDKMGKKSKVICSDPIPKRYNYITERAAVHEFEPQHIISVDIADAGLFGASLSDVKVDLAIDHHISHRAFAPQILLDAGSAANCEIIYNLAVELKIELTPYMADCIYTGVSTDTGCFKYGNTTPTTMRIGAKLIEAGANFIQINKDMFDTKSRERLSLERMALDSMKFYFGGKVAFICFTDEMIKSTGASDSDFEGISPITRQIEGVDAGVVLREKEGGFKMSMRTNYILDASEVCATLGGGGHKRAAGAFLNLPMQESIEKVLETLAKFLGEEA